MDELNFVQGFIKSFACLTLFEQEYLCRKYGLGGHEKMELHDFKDWYASTQGGTTKSYTVTKQSIYRKLLKSFFP